MFSRRSLKEDMTASRSEPEIEDAMDATEVMVESALSAMFENLPESDSMFTMKDSSSCDFPPTLAATELRSDIVLSR